MITSARQPTGSPFQDQVSKWHAELTEPGSRGARAELRRATTLEDVMFTAGYHDLRRRLTGNRYDSATRIALVAGVTAEVDARDEISVAVRMGRNCVSGRRARVSELRFRRLLQVREPMELLQVMRRLLRFLREDSLVVANVADLAESLYSWNESTARRWACDYYDERPAAGGKRG